MRCFCVEQPKSWAEFIPWAEYWNNTCYQGAARCTPFEIVYGRPPPLLARFIPGEVLVEAVAQDLMERDEALNYLKFHLNRVQNHMIKFANNHYLPSKIKEGDWLYLKIRPHRQASMPTRLNPKLSARYYGPYRVVKQIGVVAFQLQLPETARIHLVFHISQLKLVMRGHQIEVELPKELQVEEQGIQPEQVLGTRMFGPAGAEIPQVLIKWKG